jgi:hypothetical protein
MNKEVAVTGMEVKAHAEEGLLINEVAAAGSNTWDELATGGWTDAANAIQLRPASTSDLENWWHANSKKSNTEAGASGAGAVDTVNTVDLGSGSYYSDISSGSALTSQLQSGSGGVRAETNVYYKEASFGSAGQYDNGEGYYVMYKYYLKSSKTGAVNGDPYGIKGDKLLVKVTATKKNSDNSGSGTTMLLDKALRVGVKIDSSVKIFAPLYNDNQEYYVATAANTVASEETTAYKGNADTEFAADSVTFNIPNVVTDGKEVDVYVWFEGEDPNCKSDNLTAILDTYQIDINFKDAGLNSY